MKRVAQGGLGVGRLRITGGRGHEEDDVGRGEGSTIYVDRLKGGHECTLQTTVMGVLPGIARISGVLC